MLMLLLPQTLEVPRFNPCFLWTRGQSSLWDHVTCLHCCLISTCSSKTSTRATALPSALCPVPSAWCRLLAVPPAPLSCISHLFMACSHESSSCMNVCSSGGEAPPPEKCVLCSPGSLAASGNGSQGSGNAGWQEVEGSAESQHWGQGRTLGVRCANAGK